MEELVIDIDGAELHHLSAASPDDVQINRDTQQTTKCKK